MPVGTNTRATSWLASGDEASFSSRGRELACALGADLLANRPGASLSDLSGAALAFEWLDRCCPTLEWSFAARECLQTAADLLQGRPDTLISLGLFDGLAGLAFSVFQLSRQGTRYCSLHAQLHDLVVAEGLTHVRAIRSRVHLSASDYDLISGATGLGVYALTAVQAPGSLRLLEECLDFIASRSLADSSLPSFFIYPAQIESPSMGRNYPQGYLDCGTAHGMAGPIALLALALEEGFERPAWRAALCSMVEWLTAQGQTTAFGVNWPFAVANDSGAVIARAAWCYGNPCIARALWLAGRSLRRDDIQTLAMEAHLTVSRMPRSLWQITSPTFCHGLAGLVHISARFADETRDPLAKAFASGLREELLHTLSPLGNQVSQGWKQNSFGEPNELLEGAAGVILTLLASDASVPPCWDRMFLLS